MTSSVPTLAVAQGAVKGILGDSGPASSGGPCVPDSGDMAWMLTSTVLVLSMFPGLAFFQIGLLRKKNTISVLAQIFCGLPLLSTMWFMFGYSLTFGSDVGEAGFIGDLSDAFLASGGFTSCDLVAGGKIPVALYALFQMMFACITPLLMTGAYAERLAWAPFLCLTVLWEILVYYPVAHWIWHPHGWLAALGVQDFAGGIVIHTTAGASSLVACIVLGHRHGYDKNKGVFPYSNLPLACIGASFLWTGWFGFNGGSALGANSVAVHAVLNSQIAASTCATTLLLVTYITTKTPSTIVMLNGVIGGLAGVTPASGYITPLSAFLLGIILALCIELGAHVLKKLRVDDALEVSVVHGLTGVVGALFIGIAGNSSVNPVGKDGLVSSQGGNWGLIGVQLMGVCVCGAWAAVATYLILKLIQLKTPLRVSHHHEVNGLDQSIHKETASFAGVDANFFMNPVGGGSGTNYAPYGALPRPNEQLNRITSSERASPETPTGMHRGKAIASGGPAILTVPPNDKNGPSSSASQIPPTRGMSMSVSFGGDTFVSATTMASGMLDESSRLLSNSGTPITISPIPTAQNLEAALGASGGSFGKDDLASSGSDDLSEDEPNVTEDIRPSEEALQLRKLAKRHRRQQRRMEVQNAQFMVAAEQSSNVVSNPQPLTINGTPSNPALVPSSLGRGMALEENSLIK